MSVPETGYHIGFSKNGQEVKPQESIYHDYYPVQLSARDGSSGILQLPFREFPDGEGAIALLMTNQGEFEADDFLNDLLTANIRDINPDVIVGLPTLGLTLAENVARRLSHINYAPLTNSIKFWQRKDLIVPVSSVTSGKGKVLCLDQYLVDRIKGKVAVIQDDVTNTGESLVSALELTRIAEAKEIYINLVMTEGHDWEPVLTKVGFDWQTHLRTLGHIPIFDKQGDGWIPKPETL